MTYSARTRAKDPGETAKQSLRMDELNSMKSSISEVPIFKQCSPKFVEAIAEQVRHALFTPGTDIMTEGEHGDSMYILHRGDVEVLIGGNRVCTLSDGAVFGEIAALCKNPVLARRTATIRAITLCDCRMTERDSLLKIVSRFKADEDILMKKLEARFAELRGMGKLPNKKEWWRVEVKSAANEAPAGAPGTGVQGLMSKVRASLPAISAMNAARKLSAATKLKEEQRMKPVRDEEGESVASTPNPDEKSPPSRGQLDFPVWALEVAAKRTQSSDRTEASPAPGYNSPRQVSSRRRSSYSWHVRTPSTGPNSAERPRKPRSKRGGARGPTCIASVALLKAEAEQFDDESQMTIASHREASHEWYEPVRGQYGGPGMPPVMPPAEPRDASRRHHSAGVRSFASPPKLRDIRDIRTPRI